MSWQTFCVALTMAVGCGNVCFAASTMTLDKKWPASKLVNVNANFLSVKIEGENRSDIQAISTLENLGDDVTYEWSVKEDEEELHLRLISSDIPYAEVEGTITLKVPHNTSVRVNNLSGDVWVYHLKSQEIAVKTASGDITFQDCQGTVKGNSASGEINASRLKGTLKFRNVSGDLHLNNLEGSISSRTTSGYTEAYHLQGDVEIEASCGSVSVEDVTGELEIETRAGPIKVRALRATEEVNLRSITGNIQLAVVQPLRDLSVQINTDTGTVSVAKQKVARKWSQDRAEAVKLKLATISGSIQLDSI